MIEGLIDEEWVYFDEQCGPMKSEFTIIATAVGFFLPLLIMLVMYALSVRALNKEAAAVSALMPPIRKTPTCKPIPEKNENTEKSGKSAQGHQKNHKAAI